MKTVLPILLASAFLLVFTSAARCEPKIFLDHIENDENPDVITVTEWYITPQEFDQLPAYDPASGTPPVSIAEAIKIAAAEMRKEIEPAAKPTLDTIELGQLDRGNTGETAPEVWTTQLSGKWFYKVTWSVERPDPRTGVYTYPLAIYVLMDQTLALKRTRPQTKEERDTEQDMVSQMTKAAADQSKKDSK
jgi:hypothetical protein